MKKSLRISLVILDILTVVTKSHAQISLYDLLGRWEMQTVYVGGAEATYQYIQDKKRWIEFDSDFTFVSDGDSYGRKKGTFSLNEDSGLLSFDIDLGFGQKSFWHIELDGQKMIWTDRGNPTTDKVKIILVHDY
jgi:hypothetical protein